jgi:small subunit ribosomal protein S2
VIALCSTNNTTRNVDLVIPINNKGRRSLALVYWLLTKQTLAEKGAAKEGREFTKTVDDFEYQIKEEEKRAEERKKIIQRREKRRKK